ncbi:hypothetical protein GCM10023231_36720 [Olivibacter ginsenosidimutans]|uniref:Uncharacterized protein n=1 Tax=Olivibacter ginsenosidimutans TaxID=1176537 RepID=A0ABP9C357_9SPHI
MIALYNPFQKFLFDNNTCFLSGTPLLSAEEKIHVFPVWLMQAYQLEDKPFKLLDESITTYKKLQLPCSTAVANRIALLEEEVEAAFNQGVEGVKQLDKLILFQWIGKLIYGIIFNEIQVGLRQQQMSGEPMNFSQVLGKKFTNLHLMLQSIIRPMLFEVSAPYSINVFELATDQNGFSYRDEINTLVFSLRINNIGIVACLQDNGANDKYHEEQLTQVSNEQLHPIQFEEICGLYFYSAYLFNRLPEYTVLTTEDCIYIEPMPLRGMDSRPIFDNFQVKTYGQVLENFWKPWGYTLFEIIKDPEHPMSFLWDAQGNFRQAASIPLADKYLD